MERRWRRKSRRYKGIGCFAWFRDPKRDILDLWISTTAPAQANELRGLVDWLVHDGDAAFFAFSLSLLPSSFNGLLLPYFPPIFVISFFAAAVFFSFALCLLFSFQLFAVTCRWHCKSDLSLAFPNSPDTLFDIQIALLHWNLFTYSLILFSLLLLQLLFPFFFFLENLCVRVCLVCYFPWSVMFFL